MNLVRLTRVALLGGAISVTMTACVNFAPEYARPAAPVAAGWPAAQISEPGTVLADDLDWKEFYGDERLRTLITLALNNNRSLRQTALDVESARAQFRITRASALPTVDASASGTAERSAGQTSHTYTAALGISAFELDFFGRINNLRGQALETFLAKKRCAPCGSPWWPKLPLPTSRWRQISKACGWQKTRWPASRNRWT